MLPFLKNKNQSTASIIMQTRKPDIAPEEKGSENEGLESCMADLSSALESKDHAAAAKAFKAALECCEDSPEDEQNDYDSQNESAAKDNE